MVVFKFTIADGAHQKVPCVLSPVTAEMAIPYHAIPFYVGRICTIFIELYHIVKKANRGTYSRDLS